MDGVGGLAVEQPFPQLGNLDFWEGIVFGVREEQGELFDCLVPCFLVYVKICYKLDGLATKTYRMMQDICPTAGTRRTCLFLDRIGSRKRRYC